VSAHAVPSGKLTLATALEGGKETSLGGRGILKYLEITGDRLEISDRTALLFPIGLLILWLPITALLGWLTGWFGLMRRYPDNKDQALVSPRLLSGTIGGIQVLNLGACPSGLRVAMTRLFGPFLRPFLVPWCEVSAAPSSFLFLPMIKLTFGTSDRPALWIYARTWDQLLERAPAAAPHPQSLPQFTNQDLLKGLAVQWMIMTALPASFFYFSPSPPDLSVGACIGVPALLVGCAQIIRYRALRRSP